MSATARITGTATVWLTAVIFLAAAGAPSIAPAQGLSPDRDEQLRQMKRLEFMVGEWKGQAVHRLRGDKESTVFMHEKIESKLDGLALLIDGRGTMQDQDGKERIGHMAVGLINYDTASQKYRFIAQTEKGHFTIADANFLDDNLVWSFKAGPQATMRYRIRLNDKGQWRETGEFSQDGATVWAPFFEMTLNRVK